MQSCDTPAANKNGIIRLPGGGILANPSTSLEFTTDENGYFKVTHNESFSDFSVRTSASHSVLEVESMGGDKKELGEVYVFPPSVSYFLYLEVDSAYTENDTLFYYDWNHSGNGENYWTQEVPGPFSSGIIDTVHDVSNPNALPINYDGQPVPKIKVSYHINNYNSNKDLEVKTFHCKDEYQTVIIKIE